MAVRLMDAVWKLGPEVVDAVERLVLLAIADYQGSEEDFAFPSGETLARKTSLTRQGVQKIVARLESRGLLEVQRRPSGNRYRVVLDGNAVSTPLQTPLATAANRVSNSCQRGLHKPSGNRHEPSPGGSRARDPEPPRDQPETDAVDVGSAPDPQALRSPDAPPGTVAPVVWEEACRLADLIERAEHDAPVRGAGLQGRALAFAWVLEAPATVGLDGARLAETVAGLVCPANRARAGRLGVILEGLRRHPNGALPGEPPPGARHAPSRLAEAARILTHLRRQFPTKPAQGAFARLGPATW
ncbi:MarR family transcriptional regulator [bacterium]|nr:MarR family transcriptional regulator [bacterium]